MKNLEEMKLPETMAATGITQAYPDSSRFFSSLPNIVSSVNKKSQTHSASQQQGTAAGGTGAGISPLPAQQTPAASVTQPSAQQTPVTSVSQPKKSALSGILDNLKKVPRPYPKQSFPSAYVKREYNQHRVPLFDPIGVLPSQPGLMYGPIRSAGCYMDYGLATSILETGLSISHPK